MFENESRATARIGFVDIYSGARCATNCTPSVLLMFIKPMTAKLDIEPVGLETVTGNSETFLKRILEIYPNT